MAASLAFKISGVEPPDYALRPDLHAEFWKVVVALGLQVKDRELSEGKDAFGAPMVPISQYTREHRKSAMGPADPNAPPLTPAYGLSRTRSLLDGRAHVKERYALFFWRADEVTGKPWGKMLALHRKGGKKLPVRNVIGLSPAGTAEVAARARQWWDARVKHVVPIPEPVKVPTPPGAVLIKHIPAYKPKNPAHAIPKANRHISLTQIGENVYTHAGGSTAQIMKAVASPTGGFSGFAKRGYTATGELTAAGAKAKAFGAGGYPRFVPPHLRPPGGAPPPPAAPAPKPKPAPKPAPKKPPETTPAKVAPERLPVAPPRPGDYAKNPLPPETTPPKVAPRRKPVAPPRGGSYELNPLPPGAEKGPKPKKPRKPRTKKTEAPPAAAAPATAAFPAELKGLELVRTLGGSTGAELVRDPATGRLYVRKMGNNAAHIREEALADTAYQALGARVPEHRLYETANGPVKLAEYVEGRTLGDVMKADPKLAAKAIADAQQHFAADALLGNWDVVGMNYDNILVDAAGRAWRIDNGGSLRFRAQGAQKTAAQWDQYPTELWTLRDAAKNPQTAKVFGGLEFKTIVEQIGALEGKTVKLPQVVAEVVRGRMDQLKNVAKTATTLMDDKFHGHYADGFTQHQVGIRKAGIAERMPTKIERRNATDVTVYDQGGNAWDHLRGQDSLVAELERYVAANGGNYNAIKAWMGSQAGASWNESPAALKAFLVASRDVSPDAYYWKTGKSYRTAKKLLEDNEQLAGGAEKYRASFQALHAFTHEYLTKADFSTKDAAAGTIQLLRTEDRSVMERAGLKRGDTGVTLTRGAAESTSMFNVVAVHGAETTVQQVPIHRIIATYWQERYNGHTGDGAFMNSRENEAVALLEGIPFDYRRPN